MNKKDEALKLALECIEAWDRGCNASDYWRDRFDAITAIREALAEQPAPAPEVRKQQEPVAWLIWLHGPAGHFDHKQFAELEFERRNKEYPDPDRKLLPLYTSPPPRKPLLASDIVTMYDENPRSDSEMIAFARAIEAAHGITGEQK